MRREGATCSHRKAHHRDLRLPLIQLMGGDVTCDAYDDTPC